MKFFFKDHGVSYIAKSDKTSLVLQFQWPQVFFPRRYNWIIFDFLKAQLDWDRNVGQYFSLEVIILGIVLHLMIDHETMSDGDFDKWVEDWVEVEEEIEDLLVELAKRDDALGQRAQAALARQDELSKKDKE